MVQVRHLLGNFEGGERFDALSAGRFRRREQFLQVQLIALDVVTAQEAEELRGGAVLGRQQIRAARDVVQEGDCLLAQRAVLLEVLEVLGHPVPAESNAN